MDKARLKRVTTYKGNGELLGRTSLLVLDKFRPYTTEVIKKNVGELKTWLAVIPGRLVSHLPNLMYL